MIPLPPPQARHFPPLSISNPTWDVLNWNINKPGFSLWLLEGKDAENQQRVGEVGLWRGGKGKWGAVRGKKVIIKSQMPSFSCLKSRLPSLRPAMNAHHRSSWLPYKRWGESVEEAGKACWCVMLSEMLPHILLASDDLCETASHERTSRGGGWWFAVYSRLGIGYSREHKEFCL